MRPAVLLSLFTMVLAPIGRVRAPSREIVAVIQDASARSKTFRGLLATIEDTDGLVYVESGKCGHSVRACLLLSVKVAGPNRVLRIHVDARLKDCELIEGIGHELQHVVEILSNPHVTDMHSAYSFFEQIGRTGSERFETPEALHVGERVGDECRSNQVGRP
jgi:hypothetical protein